MLRLTKYTQLIKQLNDNEDLRIFYTQWDSKYVFKWTWWDQYFDSKVYHGWFEFGNTPLVKDIFACTAWFAKHLFCWDLKSLSKSFSLTKSVRGNNLNNSPDIKVSLQNWEAVICVLPFLCSFTTSVFFRLRPLRWTSADLWDLNRFVFQEGYVVIGSSQCFLSKTRSLEKQCCHPSFHNIYNSFNIQLTTLLLTHWHK